MANLLEEGSVSDMTKDELKKFVKGLIDSEMEKKFSKEREEEIRKIVRTMMRKHYYLMWQKAPFFIDAM
jgi:ABC-type dipeptide/oligopeptide/nickel transport system ATPase component